MKIVHIITRSDNVGGAQVHVLELCKGLQRAGIEVTVLVGGTGEFLDLLRDAGLPYISIPALVRSIRPTADVVALWQILSILRRIRPHLVCTHSSKAGWLGRLAAKLLRIPAIHTAHGWPFTEGVSLPASVVYSQAERVAAWFTDRIIAVSEYDRKLALRKKVCEPDKIVTIHNGISDLPNIPRARPEVEPPRIIMVARLEQPKDPISLVKALATLKQLVWSLDIVGDGPLRSAVESAVRNAGLEGRVRLLGNRRDVPELLQQAQLFVLVSKWEGFPISILEAMRSGLPVVASDVGGVREAVLHGKTGFLVERENPDDLREKLAIMLCNPGLRRSMGDTGRLVFEQHHMVEQMILKTIDVYREVIADHRS